MAMPMCNIALALVCLASIGQGSRTSVETDQGSEHKASEINQGSQLQVEAQQTSEQAQLAPKKRSQRWMALLTALLAASNPAAGFQATEQRLSRPAIFPNGRNAAVRLAVNDLRGGHSDPNGYGSAAAGGSDPPQWSDASSGLEPIDDSSDASSDPRDWRQLTDTSSGRAYYQHRLTGQTTWTPPSQQLLADWTQLTDPSSGKPYYRNYLTGETSWMLPAAKGAPQAARASPQPSWQHSPYDAQASYRYGEQKLQASNPYGAQGGGLQYSFDGSQFINQGGYGYGAKKPEASMTDKLKTWGHDAMKTLGLDERSQLEKKRKAEADRMKRARVELPSWARAEQANSYQRYQMGAERTPPAEWEQLTDPSSGRSYYRNRATGQTSWTPSFP